MYVVYIKYITVNGLTEKISMDTIGILQKLLSAFQGLLLKFFILFHKKQTYEACNKET